MALYSTILMHIQEGKGEAKLSEKVCNLSSAAATCDQNLEQ